MKRQYSGTLAKLGNCRIGVSVHAVGKRGTAPRGWALYLPEEWCDDGERRAKAKIPAEIEFTTKPELGVALVERAAGWGLPAAPLVGDQAYGDKTALRDRLHKAGREYVLAVGPASKVFAPETVFNVPEATAARGRPKSRPRPDREPDTIADLDREGRRRAGPDGRLPRRPRRQTTQLPVRVRAGQGRPRLAEGNTLAAP